MGTIISRLRVRPARRAHWFERELLLSTGFNCSRFLILSAPSVSSLGGADDHSGVRLSL
jgi:hypothetical protein